MRPCPCAFVALTATLLVACADREPKGSGADEDLCRTEERQPQAPSEEASLAERLNPGYQLVYATLDRLAGLSRITWLKKESDEFEEVVEAVSDVAGEVVEDLEELAEDDDLLDLEGKPMPEVIGQARKKMGEEFSEDVKPFGGESGPPMERQVLLLVQQALTESRFVVRELAIMEQSDARHEVLQDADARLGEVLRRVQRTLERRHYCE